MMSPNKSKKAAEAVRESSPEPGPSKSKRPRSKILTSSDEEEETAPRRAVPSKVGSKFIRSPGFTSHNKPAELFRKDLISAMKMADSEQLHEGSYIVIADPWRQEWEKGVQVPVNLDEMLKTDITEIHEKSKTGDFKIPHKLLHERVDNMYKKGLHELTGMQQLSEQLVRYDLDDLDVCWLEEVNFIHREMGVDQINEWNMERVMEALENQCHEKMTETMKTEEGMGIEYDENIVCDVCRSPDSEDANEMVFCDGCDVCVHQACYGLQCIPEGSWLCRTCALGIKPACMLCPNQGGAMKSTRSGTKWAHVSCALWIPEVSIGVPEKMEPICKISSIPPSRWALICNLCKERVGACIQCSVKTCKTAFHVTCGFNNNLDMRTILTDSEEDQDEGVKFRAYCLKHSRKRDPHTSESSDGDSTQKEHPPTPKKEMTHEERENLRMKKLKNLEEEFYSVVDLQEICTMLQLDPEIVDIIFAYWKLKRKCNRDKPLLTPKTEEADILEKQQEDSLVARQKMFVSLRQDLERVRNLCYMISKREKMKRSFFRKREEVFFGILRPLVDKTISLSDTEAEELVDMYSFDSLYADYGRSVPNLPPELFQDEDDDASEVVKDKEDDVDTRVKEDVKEEMKEEEDEEEQMAEPPIRLQPGERISSGARTGFFKRRRHKPSANFIMSQSKKSKPGASSSSPSKALLAAACNKQSKGEEMDTSWHITSGEESDDEKKLALCPVNPLLLDENVRKQVEDEATDGPKFLAKSPKARAFGLHMHRHKKRGRKPWHMKPKYNLASNIDLSSSDEGDDDMKVSPVQDRSRKAVSVEKTVDNTTNAAASVVKDHEHAKVDDVELSAGGGAHTLPPVEPVVEEKSEKPASELASAESPKHGSDRKRRRRDRDRGRRRRRERDTSDNKDSESRQDKNRDDSEKVPSKNEKDTGHVESQRERIRDKTDKDTSRSESRKEKTIDADEKDTSRKELKREKTESRREKAELKKEKSRDTNEKDTSLTESRRERHKDKSKKDTESRQEKTRDTNEKVTSRTESRKDRNGDRDTSRTELRPEKSRDLHKKDVSLSVSRRERHGDERVRATSVSEPGKKGRSDSDKDQNRAELGQGKSEKQVDSDKMAKTEKETNKPETAKDKRKSDSHRDKSKDAEKKDSKSRSEKDRGPTKSLREQERESNREKEKESRRERERETKSDKEKESKRTQANKAEQRIVRGKETEFDKEKPTYCDRRRTLSERHKNKHEEQESEARSDATHKEKEGEPHLDTSCREKDLTVMLDKLRSPSEYTKTDHSERETSHCSPLKFVESDDGKANAVEEAEVRVENSAFKERGRKEKKPEVTPGKSGPTPEKNAHDKVKPQSPHNLRRVEHEQIHEKHSVRVSPENTPDANSELQSDKDGLKQTLRLPIPLRTSKRERNRSGQSVEQCNTPVKQNIVCVAASTPKHQQTEIEKKGIEETIESAVSPKPSAITFSPSPSPSKRPRLDRQRMTNRKFQSEKAKAADLTRQKEEKVAEAPSTETSPSGRGIGRGSDHGERSNIFESLERQRQEVYTPQEPPMSLSVPISSGWSSSDWHRKLGRIVGEAATEAVALVQHKSPNSSKSGVAEDDTKSTSNVEESDVGHGHRKVPTQSSTAQATEAEHSRRILRHVMTEEKPMHSADLPERRSSRKHLVSETSHESEDVRERHHRKSSDQARLKLNKVFTAREQSSDDDFELTKPVSSLRTHLHLHRPSRRRTMSHRVEDSDFSFESSCEDQDSEVEDDSDESGVERRDRRASLRRREVKSRSTSSEDSLPRTRSATSVRPEIGTVIRPKELIVESDLVQKIEKAVSKRAWPGGSSKLKNGAFDTNQKKIDLYFARNVRTNAADSRETSVEKAARNRVLSEIPTEKGSNFQNNLFGAHYIPKGSFGSYKIPKRNNANEGPSRTETAASSTSTAPLPSVDGVFGSGAAASLHSFSSEVVRASPRLRNRVAGGEERQPRKLHPVGSDEESVISSTGDNCEGNQFSMESCRGYRSQSPSSDASTVQHLRCSSRESTPRRLTRSHLADDMVENSPTHPSSGETVTRMKLRDGVLKASLFKS